MNYSKDFIERCKEFYPEDEVLHSYLDSGNPEVGIILSKSVLGYSRIDLSWRWIINESKYNKEKLLDEILRMAIWAEKAHDLYVEWLEIAHPGIDK